MQIKTVEQLLLAIGNIVQSDKDMRKAELRLTMNGSCLEVHAIEGSKRITLSGGVSRILELELVSPYSDPMDR